MARRVVLIGTPSTLRALAAQVREDRSSRPALCVVGCFVAPIRGGRGQPDPDLAAAESLDDFIGGIPVLGGLKDIGRYHKTEAITLALVSLSAAQSAIARRARMLLEGLGIPSREVTPLADLVRLASAASDPQANIRLSPTISLADLIGRTPYGIDPKTVARVIGGKRILITGAGGSIGSELCRIACTFKPEELVMVERSENALFEIDRQIARNFPGVKRRACLHDCVDAHRTLDLLALTRPHTVFHAAAHKHVPLMEDHPAAAVTNNVMGTKSVADAAVACGSERFVMISSDKAVNPSSVMGATKRLAEMYVQHLAAQRQAGNTSLSMVRFGNVLGSACSVLPIWAAQLAEGGPITVTDERMTRYFMTINEAAALVIQSSALDCRGGKAPSIYVLDMGAPLRILDLAQRFARLNNHEPVLSHRFPSFSANAIEIRLTGARPGEKLHEELSYAAEALSPTPYPGILALCDSAKNAPDMSGMIDELSGAANGGDHGAVLAAIRAFVPEMGAAPIEPFAATHDSSAVPNASPFQTPIVLRNARATAA